MSKERDQPIIIKKKKGGGHGHHGGAWKVAFADFMTAMFAMFLVLWLVNQSTDVRDAVANYFRDPIGWDSGGQRTVGNLRSVQARPQRSPERGALRSAGSRSKLESIARTIRQQIDANQRLHNARSNVTIEMIAEGLRISLTEDPNTTFFDTGSAHLKDQATEVLMVVGAELATMSNRIMIEGHTDSRPYGRSNYSNWELSTDRAHEARRILISAGLPDPNVYQVRGFADRDLLVPEEPNSPRNRRITITVLDPEAPLPSTPSAPAAESAADGGAAEAEPAADGGAAAAAPDAAAEPAAGERAAEKIGQGTTRSRTED
jgi:chemotaxis protein MotB